MVREQNAKARRRHREIVEDSDIREETFAESVVFREPLHISADLDAYVQTSFRTELNIRSFQGVKKVKMFSVRCEQIVLG